MIDPTVGLVFSKKVADPVKKGDVLATIYGNDEEKVKQAVLQFLKKITILIRRKTNETDNDPGSIILNLFA